MHPDIFLRRYRHDMHHTSQWHILYKWHDEAFRLCTGTYVGKNQKESGTSERRVEVQEAC